MTSQGWRTATIVLICGGIVLSLSIGIRQSFGLFLAPMSTDLGWGREVFAFAIAVQNILWGATQPFFGMAADRWGGGRILAVSGALYALGLYLMSTTADVAAFNISAGLLIGLALSGTSFAVVLGAVGRAFPPEKRSAALGIASAGGSFGQFIMVPLGQAAIDAYGWSLTFVLLACLAALMVALAVPLAGKPQVAADAGGSQSIGEALAEARRHPGFLYLNAGFFVCGFHITFIGTHLPAYLTDLGLSATAASVSLALVGLFNIIGSLACGAAGGRYSKKYLLSGVYLARSAIILAFLLAPASNISAYLFGAGMGLLWLGTVPLTSALVAQIFGPRYMSTLFGIVFFSHQVGAFLGVWLGGRIYDTTGSYDTVWWIAIALGLLAAALHLPINERPVPRLRPAL